MVGPPSPACEMSASTDPRFYSSRDLNAGDPIKEPEFRLVTTLVGMGAVDMPPRERCQV